MQVIVNGSPTEVSDHIRVDALIQQLGLEGRRLAVEVNRELVPRSRFGEQVLAAGDCIEIIHAVGGG